MPNNQEHRINTGVGFQSDGASLGRRRCRFSPWGFLNLVAGSGVFAYLGIWFWSATRDSRTGRGSRDHGRFADQRAHVLAEVGTDSDRLSLSEPRVDMSMVACLAVPGLHAIAVTRRAQTCGGNRGWKGLLSPSIAFDPRFPRVS